jgi:glycine betaine/choline ABC-type transport system substrate-binding protein
MPGQAAELVFDEATKQYAGRSDAAVDRLSLTVPAGEISVLVGPSGGGKTTAGDVFSTDPQLQSSKYTVLTDTKHIFGFQNVAPVVSKSLVSAGGSAFAGVVNAVSAKLTLDAMRAMNRAVAIDKQSPAAVASAFLNANHLK